MTGIGGDDAARRHTPVMLGRCVDLLAPALAEPGSVMIDATLGMGGHTDAVLRECPNARVIGLDRDAAALALAGHRLEGYGTRFEAVHAVYDSILSVAARTDRRAVQAVLMDLGVSSLQIDSPERGFSYAQDAPLDMRMDPSGGTTAAEILATYTAPELARILRAYGEERFAGRIARGIVEAREAQPIERSTQLVKIVLDSIPAAARWAGGNPAKRTFQALRIEVNAELEVLERAVPAAVEALAVGGRIVVLAYHSLEDRLVKRTFARGATSSAPAGLPVELESHRPYLRLLTRGAEEASAAERSDNPRSASVRLRAAERVRATPDHLRSGVVGGRVA